MAIDKRISYAFGGTGGKTGGKGGQNGSADRGGKAHKAAAEKAQKAARDARESNARENAIRTAALTTKTKAPTRSPHKDTPTQKKEQLAIDLSDFESEDKKVKAPKTLTPRTKIIDQGVPHLEDPITKTVPHYYGGIGSKTTYGFGPKGCLLYTSPSPRD